MKNSIKRVVSVIVALVIALSLFALAACDGGNNEPTPVVPQIKTYEVLFGRNCEDQVVEPDTQVIEEGKTATRPADPVRRGYEFTGWYLDEQATRLFDFSTPIMAETVLYAGWEVEVIRYTVSFDLNGGTGTIADQTVVSGERAQEPATNPTRSNYRFDGWYLEQAGTTAYNFNNAVTANFRLYAKWTRLYTVTFNYNYTGAPAATASTVPAGESAIRPQDPSRGTDYIFAGWFTDAAATTPYAFGAVNANTTVYAGWSEAAAQTFDVVFNFNYTGAPTSVTRTVPNGGIVSAPSVGERQGFIFTGWYSDQNCTTPFDVNAAVNANAEVYAGWAASVTVTFNNNYTGSEPSETNIASGGKVTKPADPSRIGGYTFAFWSNASDSNVSFDFDTAITENTVLYAQWRSDFYMEAEDLDWEDFKGFGFSGGSQGLDVIVDATELPVTAHNDHYVYCLNATGATLDFMFTSDRAEEDVVIKVWLSAEIKDITLYSSGNKETQGVFTVTINGTLNDYGSFAIENVPDQSSPNIHPFEALEVMGNLVKGENHIILKVDNSLGQGGTMEATAPMIDCVQIVGTTAVLGFTPHPLNY